MDRAVQEEFRGDLIQVLRGFCSTLSLELDGKNTSLFFFSSDANVRYYLHDVHLATI